MSIVDSGNSITFDLDASACPPSEQHPLRDLSRRIALGGRIKRVLDVSLALVALVILSPLFVMVSLAVRSTSKGPVLFGHTRVGFGSATFRCWKFRTMVSDGEGVLEQHFQAFPGERFEWETNRKLKNDPRVTWIGNILRVYSVDELPQLLNVLRGDMSIVGPRPVVLDELKMYGSSAALYLGTRPGITGLWQTSGRSDIGYGDRVSLDCDYVNNWSIWKDCKIILKTIPTVIAAEGSY